MFGYLEYLSWYDRIILTLGGMAILTQVIFYGMYVMKVADFDRTVMKWLDWLSMFFELFPLLGLLGTVFGLLNTFKNVKLNSETGLDIGNMLGDFAPALTSTVSGIIALMINLFVFICLIRIITSIEEGGVRR